VRDEEWILLEQRAAQPPLQGLDVDRENISCLAVHQRLHGPSEQLLDGVGGRPVAQLRNEGLLI
jgi:hypothetical protein